MSNQQPVKNNNRSTGRTIVILAAMAVAGLYLINPTAGILEFIPDNLPLVGNIDEAGAALMMISGLRYFGIDLGALFGHQDSNK